MAPAFLINSHYNDTPILTNDGPEVHERAVSVVVICALLEIAILACLVARLWVRKVLQNRLGPSDGAITMATILCTALLILTVIAVRHFGWDHHSSALSVAQISRSYQVFFAAEKVYIIGSGLVKISILLFYRQLTASSTKTTFIRLVNGSIAITFMYMFSFSVCVFFTCKPIDAFWMRIIPSWLATHSDYSCVNEAAILISGGAISVVEDLVVALLPAILFWDLRMATKQKIGLTLLFGLGLFTSSAGAIRLYYLWASAYGSGDGMWQSYYVWLWSAIEVSTGVMCACGPALKALWLHVRTKPAVRKFTARVSEQGSALFMFLYRPCPTRRWPRGNATERDIAQAHQRRDSAWLAKVQGLDGSTGDYDGTKSFATVVHATDCGWWTRGQDAGPAGKDGWDTDTGSSEATDYSSRLGQFWSGHAGPVGPCAVIMETTVEVEEHPRVPLKGTDRLPNAEKSQSNNAFAM